MKILHIAPISFSSISGINTSVVGLLKSLALAGHKVGLLSAIPGDVSCVLDGIENIILVPGPRQYHRNPFYISRSWIDVIKNNFGSPDLVHFHDTYIPFETALARLFRECRWPYIFSPRGGLRNFAQKTKFLKKQMGNLFFLNHFVNEARALHALCDQEAKEIKARFPDKQIFVLPNGIDEDLFGKELILSDKRDGNKDDIIFGFMGRIDIEIKGIDILSSALKILEKNKLCKGLKFIFVGPFHTNNDKNRFDFFRKSLEYPTTVVYAGVVYGEDRWHFLNGLDVFIHPSRSEGFSNSIIEAMAFKKPCVVTPGTNMEKIILDSGGGWMCEESPQSLAKILIMIKENREEIIKRGCLAQSYVKDNFTWASLANKYIDILKNL
jgi:glycosyltransferase involved in cell wall biosynthesis